MQDTTDSESEVPMDIQSGDDSLYLPTPERMVRKTIQNTAIVPLNVCFMDLRQLEKYVCVPLPAVRGNSPQFT